MTERQLNVRYGTDFAPQWASDGSMIVAGIGRGIKGVTIDGNELWDIPIEKPEHHIDGLATYPSLSSTGRVAYLACYDKKGLLAFLGSDREECAIEVTIANGSNFEKISGIGAEINNPVWSPDGSRLAFTTEVETSYVVPYWSDGGVIIEEEEDIRVRTIATTASDVSSLIRFPVAENWSAQHPVWSSDGQRLVYISSSTISDDYANVIRDDYTGNGYVNRARIVNVRWDGTDEKIVMEHRILNRSHLPPIFEPTSLAWSPTDDRIYFVHYELTGGEYIGNVPRYAPSIRSVRHDGSDERIVALWREHFRIKGLKVSPDGSQLLFTTYHAPVENEHVILVIQKETDEELYVIKTEGSRARKVLDKVFDPVVKRRLVRSIYASWAPDSNRIAVQYLEGGPYVFTMSPDGSDTRMLIKPNIDGLPGPGRNEPLPQALVDPAQFPIYSAP